MVNPWEDPDNQYIEICKECQRITGSGCSGDPVGCAMDVLDELRFERKTMIPPHPNYPPAHKIRRQP